jgi:Acetyltransferase (GNAT) domain
MTTASHASGLLNVSGSVPPEIWRDEFATDAMAVPYQSPLWFDSLRRSGEHADASRLYEFADGRRYVLPLARRRVAMVLPVAASMPHGWGMGGLISKHPVTAEVVAAVFDDLSRLPYLQIGLRPNPLHAAAWAGAVPHGVVVTERLAHAVDLTGGFSHLWSKRFSKDTRTNVRKAERLGVRVECDSSGRLMPIFHRLLELSIDRWAAQQHEPGWLAHWRGRRRDPLAKFELIARAMGAACKVWVAWYNEEPAAAIIVLQDGVNAQDIRGAMDKRLAAPSCANDLLHSLAIEDACRSGCRFYHMGETGNSKSLAHFKTRFGADALPYAEYTIEKLPVSRMDHLARRTVKRLLRFRDTTNETGETPQADPSAA